MLLEGFGGAADFAVDDVIGVRDAGGDCAADEVFADEVDYAGYFADLGGGVSEDGGGKGEGVGGTSGMLAAGLYDLRGAVLGGNGQVLCAVM